MVAITYNLSDKTSSHEETDATAEIPLQAIALDLPLHASRALIRDIRAGKGALVEFGRQPELRCGKQTFSLKTAPSRFPSDIYRRKARGSNDYELVGSVLHDLSLVEAEKSTAAMDAAVAQLKNSLASYQQEKEANKTTILSATPNVSTVHGKRPSASTKRLFPASKKGARSTKSSLQRPDSSQISTSSKAPQSSPLPNQHPQKALIQKALRFAILHLLAIKPITMKAIVQRTRCKEEDCLDALRKIGKQTSPATDEWQLTEKAYKELDVWKFPYPSQELRQSVIDNAVRVYDRLRISPEDQQWQMLLPKHNRGKGITLSKLKLNPQPNKPIRKMTPITKPTKKPAPSKKANKNIMAEEGKRDSAGDEEDELLDEGEQESIDVQEQGPADNMVSPTAMQAKRESLGQESEDGHNISGTKEKDKSTVEDNVAGSAKRTSLDNHKAGQAAEKAKKFTVDENLSTADEKKAEDVTKMKGVAMKDKDAKAKRPLTPANLKSNASTILPRVAEEKTERQPVKDQRVKCDIKEQTYSQNSPREKSLLSVDSKKKSTVKTSPKPITTPWQPRKDRPVVRKGPNNPTSEKSSKTPAEKNNVNNNVSQDKDSARRLGTKPKIPSPLGAEPMVNVVPFSPLTLKPAMRSQRDSAGNSDAGLKRKANDVDAKEDGDFKSEGTFHKHRKTNPSTSSLSSLSSQTTSSSVGQPSAATDPTEAGDGDGERSLKRKSATSTVDNASNSPSKQRRVHSKTNTSMKARNEVGNAGNRSVKPSSGLKPVPKPAPSVASSTSTISGTISSRSVTAKNGSKTAVSSEERRITQPKTAEKIKVRHSPSNSASTVSSAASDSNSSNTTSVSATAPALTSASTSASNSDIDEVKGGTTSPLRMSFRQTVEHARKFQKYYTPYAELYERLSSSPDPPSEKDRATLMGMHEKLSVMKMEIRSGALRQA